MSLVIEQLRINFQRTAFAGRCECSTMFHNVPRETDKVGTRFGAKECGLYRVLG